MPRYNLAGQRVWAPGERVAERERKLLAWLPIAISFLALVVSIISMIIALLA